MPRHILAIDLGTSALKVALVATSGEVVASEQEECRVEYLPGGGAEQDPEHWWAMITRAAARLACRGAVPPGSVAAVSCTAQWSGTVPVDERGRALRRAIIWMDSRGAPYARRITGGRVRVRGYGPGQLARWVRVTAGIPAHSGKDPIAHILWLKYEEPETYRRARLFLEPKDWLNLRLTGQAAASYDSIALHWVTDNRRPDRILYHPGLLRRAGPVRGPASPAGQRDGHRRAAAARAGRGTRRPARHPGRGRDARPALGGDRLGGDPGLPGAPVYRHVVLADLPCPVQEDGPVPQHGLAALAHPGPVPRRRRAGDGRRGADLPAGPGPVSRWPPA